MTDNDQRDDMPGIPPVESPEPHLEASEPTDAPIEVLPESGGAVSEPAAEMLSPDAPPTEETVAEPADAVIDAPEALLIPHDLPSEPVESGWSVHETPHFGFDGPPPALQQPVEQPIQPRTPTAVLDDLDVTSDEVHQAVHRVTEDLYEDDGPSALESAAEAELIGSAAAVEEDSAAPEAAPESDEAFRIRALSRSIAQFPDAPVNYVLRGEVYLALGETERAAEDFQKAIDLAATLDPELDWGYINTAYIDRAVEGLRQINP